MIKENIVEEIKDRLVKVYDAISIYLFGLYAWGSSDEDSDLDLLIVVDTSEEKSYKRSIPASKALIDLMVPKDIIVYTKEEFEKLSSDVTTLCYKIKNEGRLIYEKL
jgi:predicted nucleotidyltransferase